MRSRTEPELKLPENLQQRFALLERRLWWVDTTIAVCGGLGGLLVSYSLVFISDRLWDTPVGLRLVLTLLGVMVAAYFLWGWFQLWVWQRRDRRALANVVQSRYRRLGDRLLGIVELADERRRAGTISPALCRAAIAQVSGEALQYDFREAVALRKPRIYSLAALLLVLLVLTPWLIVPEAGWNALARWLRPLGTVPRFTFVSLEKAPSFLVVPHGEPFEIACSARFHRFWKPSEASAQYGDQPPVKARIRGNTIVFSIPGQTQPGSLSLQIGDARRRMAIRPEVRPALKELVAKVQFPAYLQYPPAEQVVRGASLKFLTGSRAALQGRVSRALSTARMEIRDAETNLLAVELLRVEQAQFESEPLALDLAAQCALEWEDHLGLAAAGPWKLQLDPVEDLPPQAECPSQASVVAMLHDEVLEIRAAGRDDYGLRDLGLRWECAKRQETEVLDRGQAALAEGAPQATNLVATYRFAPSLMHLPEETVVTLRVVARDYLPDRPAAESLPYRIYILGHEEHAQLVQEQFEKLLAEVDEVARRQEGVLEEGRQVKESAPEQMTSPETGKELGEQADEERAVAEKTAELAQAGAEVLREAMRNKTIPTDLLKDWAQQVDTLQKLSQNQMTQASQSLSKAQQGSPSRQQELEKALEQEEQALEALQKMQKELSPALDRMLANTLAQRLRKIATFEQETARSLKTMLPETIGLPAAQLPQKHAATAARLAEGQAKSSRESQQLEEEITRFYQRTTVTNYGTVSREMRQTKPVEALLASTKLIRDNIAAQAMQQAAEWETRFTAWADLLQQGSQSESAGGGQGGGEMSEAALRRLLALMRARQSEQNLREHTRVLEEVKAGRPSYPEDSSILAVRQSLVMDDVRELTEEDPGKFLGQTKDAMGEAEKLLSKPDTGAPAVAAETDAINLLEAEIMSMMQSSQAMGQGASMALLMQMMGMGMAAGNQGGGNFAGGDTTKTGAPPGGNPAGNAALPRQVERASGRETRPLPTEYREALRQYYRAIERLKP